MYIYQLNIKSELIKLKHFSINLTSISTHFKVHQTAVDNFGSNRSIKNEWPSLFSSNRRILTLLRTELTQIRLLL